MQRMSAEQWRAQQAKPKRSKYRNKPCELDGIRFPSQREMKRYAILKRAELAGDISHLQLQQPFKISHNGVVICKYVADFLYFTQREFEGVPAFKRITEDCKGMRTREYKLKKKLMKAFFNIDIRET